MRASLRRNLRFLWSLKFAVSVLLALAFALALATGIESSRDAATAQYYVYRANWFRFLLFALGVNIVAVALSRWPWRRRHLPFLTAHLGIILLLFGAFLSDRFGIDGIIEIEEGQRTSKALVESLELSVSRGESRNVIPIPSAPLGTRYSPVAIEEGWQVAEFLAHADLRREVREAPRVVPETVPVAPGIRLILRSRNAKIERSFWLWEGDPAWALYTEGPLNFRLLGVGEAFSRLSPPVEGVPLAAFVEIKRQDGAWHFFAHDSKGKSRTFELRVGERINPGWMDFEIEFERSVDRAWVAHEYVASPIRFGDSAPPPAIRIENSDGYSFWLGLNDARKWNGTEIRFTRRTVELPFEMELTDFRSDFEHGAPTPSSYFSFVRVHTPNRAPASTPLNVIEMNEPLEVGPYTLYQTGFKHLERETQTSVLSVNRDPGRNWKYVGSFLIILGSVSLFLRKWWEARLEKAHV
jgi:hypothetical protein